MDSYFQGRGVGIGIRLYEPHEFPHVCLTLRSSHLVPAARDWSDAGLDETKESPRSYCPTELPVSGGTARRGAGRGPKRLSDRRREILPLPAPDVQLRNQEPGSHLRLRGCRGKPG